MAADAKGVPIFDFRVLSYGPLDLGANQRLYKESVWEEDKDKNWTPGEWLGEVEINEAPSDSGPKTFVAWFRFNDFPDIAVTGDLPNVSDWMGKGKALALGPGRPGQMIPVQGKNPKRWG